MSQPPRRFGTLGRADLVAALARPGETDNGHRDPVARYIADQLNLEWVARPQPRKEVPGQEEEGAVPPEQREQPRVLSVPLLDIPFWHLEAREYLPDRVTSGERPAPAPYTGWHNRPQSPPPFQPLATWAELVPRLRQVLSDYREGRVIDLNRTVALISRGRILERFPRERRRRWGPTLVLIEDDSRRLIPYRADKRLVRDAVRRLLPTHAFNRAVIDDGLERPLPLTGDPADWPPPSGTLVLALGDLGCLATQGAGIRQCWLEIGRELMNAGCFPLALFPAPVNRCTAELADLTTYQFLMTG